MHAALTRLFAEAVRPRRDAGVILAGLHARVADAFEVTECEIASPSRRRHALAGYVKRSAMHWGVRGANAIIALRCNQLSGRFEDFWERRAEVRPAA